MAKDGRTLSLHLHAPGHAPAGAPIEALADAAAGLALTAEEATLHVALPERSLTERRWIVERLVRNVGKLAPAKRAELYAASGVNDDTALAFALDLRRRFDDVVVHGRDQVAAESARIGDLERGFRAWVDEDPSTRTSLAIARDVTAWAGARDDVHTEVLTEDELGERGLRLLLAVGQGSPASPSRLVIARYTPGGKSDAPLMLLGKGVTFDSGGINVKPYESFVSMMKNDMAGAALAFHLFKGLIENGYDRPLLLVLPTCENAIGAKSMRPGALIKSYRGHMVRVDHTDAEGRLILADALSYATDTYAPSQVICFATLTTAALIAYGPYATPVHFADAALEARLRAASERTGEDLHFFPRREWHFEANRDEEADIRNTARLPGNASRGAGSRNAGHFLLHFTDRPLVHFDIFASTWNWAGDAPGGCSGATGAPLRPLLIGDAL